MVSAILIAIAGASAAAVTLPQMVTTAAALNAVIDTTYNQPPTNSKSN